MKLHSAEIHSFCGLRPDTIPWNPVQLSIVGPRYVQCSILTLRICEVEKWSGNTGNPGLTMRYGRLHRFFNNVHDRAMFTPKRSQPSAHWGLDNT